MRTRSICVVFILLLANLALGATPKVEVKTDHPDAIYRCGEPVKFLVTLKENEQRRAGVELNYKITKNGETPLSAGVIKSGEGPTEISASLNEPGFLRCEVSYHSDATTKPVTAIAGAGVEPDKIVPSLPVPEEFDAFWATQRQLLIDNPAEAKRTPVPTPDETIEAYDVQIAVPDIGRNVSGYFAKPRGAKEKSLPAILYLHSAGVRDSDLLHAVRGAKLGAIALDFNAHGVPNGKPPEFYKTMSDGELSDHRVRGMEDREQVYFRGMYLRLWRALDFLTQQPEWDGKILIVEGSSQGGGQALVIAGLDHRITLCLASVPALSDLTAAKVDRTPGWPKMLKKGDDGSLNEKAVEALRYVDVMNFASRIQYPTTISVGFIDNVCPPNSVYSAFNNIPANVNKTIVNRPAMGHSFPKDLIAEWDELIRKHIVELRSQMTGDL